MREIPKPGQIYRHFKGHLYQIVTIARHSETMEALVIYQALYGEYQVYARPLHMFLSEVDREKYSDVKQRERFELVRSANEITVDEMSAEPQSEPQPVQLDSGVEAFLDADTFEEQLRIFTGMQHRLTDDMINIMAIALDTEVPEGALENRIASLKNFLLMQVKYECNRVR
jgi:hypothetical protein